MQQCNSVKCYFKSIFFALFRLRARLPQGFISLKESIGNFAFFLLSLSLQPTELEATVKAMRAFI
jgi:hypothetical protein